MRKLIKQKLLQNEGYAVLEVMGENYLGPKLKKLINNKS